MEKREQTKSILLPSIHRVPRYISDEKERKEVMKSHRKSIRDSHTALIKILNQTGFVVFSETDIHNTTKFYIQLDGGNDRVYIPVSQGKTYITVQNATYKPTYKAQLVYGAEIKMSKHLMRLKDILGSLILQHKDRNLQDDFTKRVNSIPEIKTSTKESHIIIKAQNKDRVVVEYYKRHEEYQPSWRFLITPEYKVANFSLCDMNEHLSRIGTNTPLISVKEILIQAEKVREAMESDAKIMIRKILAEIKKQKIFN